ncbi:MAG: fibrillarin-like rRNA/tRNA 2'-O-methyltransferase [Candidatus Aenigmarchaeota archaeon]|nr:fibrillarin-like rRNA/tRNA 2'-O-methyltransferase [Candidatus Aenigmarchaeota archaeon]
MKEIFPRVFLIENKLATKNPFSGYKPFDEELLKRDKKEFRMWNPTRSKAGAAIKKGIKEFPIEKDSKILYLGAAHGYTPSFLSNIIGKKGIIYAVEFSERCFNELLILCLKYKNIVPIFADARKPELYYWMEKVDVVYVDIAQPDETEIAIRNCKEFLKPNGYLMIAIKSRSIDVTKSPKEIYKNEIKKLKDSGFKIIDWKTLDPLERAHAFIVAKL